MNTLQNIHTHTIYCDGTDTPEQMIQAAIGKGFGGIGFSGHSYMFYSPEHSMSIDGTEAYKNEITALKEKYKGQIDVFLGLEFDQYSEVDLSGYDYLIGALHYLKIGDEFVGFDRCAQEVSGIIERYFDGNGMDFAKEYYRQLATLADHGKFDIIGHFDLITKNIEKINCFDIDSEKYLKYAITSMEALRGKIPFFEVNTGAISRGYRTTPYPAKNLIKKFREMGFGAIIPSDCHNAKYLDCAFSDAHILLSECGFREHYVLTDSGFKAVGLKD